MIVQTRGLFTSDLLLTFEITILKKLIKIPSKISGVEFYATGGAATHAVVNKVKKYLDHIAYTMWQAYVTLLL